MADTYVVDVDIGKVRSDLSRVRKRAVSETDAREWLVSYGFYPRVDGLYLAEDAVLRLLDPSQIIATRLVAGLLH